MSVAGICQICERETADYTCDRCGAMVCSTHYDVRQRLCTDCAAGTKV